MRKLRAIRPDLAMSSDFIVGFPGETEDDFSKMMKLIDDVGYDNSFSFIFSPRPGTPAANLHDDTPHAVKLRGCSSLQAVIDANIRPSAPAAWAPCSASWWKARRARTRPSCRAAPNATAWSTSAAIRAW
jgi:hypothetical protein